MKAKNIQVGDRVILGGHVEKVLAVEVQPSMCLVFRFIRYQGPFCVRTWNWFGPDVELKTPDT